jgi:hypothetical protein
MTYDRMAVSVVLVNFRGASDTIEAISHLGALEFPDELLEIIVVENASGDGSAEAIRSAAPHVTVIEASENLGFAGGCNMGARASRGEVIALLNNDAKPDPRWIHAALDRFAESAEIGAVASKVLDWDGKLVDYVGSALTWYGMGYKPFLGGPVPKGADVSRDVLFGTGSAMFVRRDVFEQLGGFDERYFMFYEDVDLGWRMKLAGWRFVYEPTSIAFHKHHASMKGLGEHKEAVLLERNALFTLYKNLDADNLNRVLPAVMALAVRRSVARSKLDSGSFDIRRQGADEPELTVPKLALTSLFAIDQFVEQLPGLRRDRDRIQSSRQVPDSAVWRLFGSTDAPISRDKSYLAGYENLVNAFEIAEEPKGTRVLIITGDPIGAQLAGPAIRAWSMAELLARDNEVTLLTLSDLHAKSDDFVLAHVRAGDEKAFAPYERWADIIVFQGHAMAAFDGLRNTDKLVVADIYDPMHLEQLEQGRALPGAVWRAQVDDATDVLNEQLARADFLICASERQRHFYLGQLAGLGRINPATYVGDPDLRRLIDVAPFGMSSTPPIHERAALKGVVPGIGVDDKVLLWSGGLYDWFDPHTLIRAVALLRETRGNVHLYFQGTKHPHPGVPEMGIVSSSRRLAKDLGVLDKGVHFNDSWVPYADRQNYLTEADAGVSTHFAHLESTFSFRTRILDYLWAGLPMVVTRGDHFAELIEAERLGLVVEPQDVEGLAFALETVLFDKEFAALARANVQRVRESFYWGTVLAPLVRFVANPRRAADRGIAPSGMQARSRTAPRPRRSGLGHDLRRTSFYLKNGGLRVVLRKVLVRLRWA